MEDDLQFTTQEKEVLSLISQKTILIYLQDAAEKTKRFPDRKVTHLHNMYIALKVVISFQVLQNGSF